MALTIKTFADGQAIKQQFDGVDERFDGIDQTFDSIDNSLKQLGEDFYELKIRKRAIGIFGRYVKRGRDVTNEIGEKLDEAEDNGLISEDEGDRVLAADLLWGGKLKATKACPEERGKNVVLVVELSWWAEQNDVDRAENRAAILRRIGVTALPVVGGNNGWADGLPEVAHRGGVVMMTGMRFDKASWKAAIDAIS
jgi:hypothetical protein